MLSPISLKATSTSFFTLCVLLVAMTKSSGLSCCNIIHIAYQRKEHSYVSTGNNNYVNCSIFFVNFKNYICKKFADVEQQKIFLQHLLFAKILYHKILGYTVVKLLRPKSSVLF